MAMANLTLYRALTSNGLQNNVLFLWQTFTQYATSVAAVRISMSFLYDYETTHRWKTCFFWASVPSWPSQMN